MRRILVAIVLSVAIALSIAGCGSGGSESGPPASQAPTSAPAVSSNASKPGSSLAFESKRYGYALELPDGWLVREEAPGLWTPSSLSYVGSGTDSFEEDYPDRGATPDYPGITYGLYVSANEPSRLPSLDAWTDKLAATMDSDSSCQGDPDRVSMTVAGERAIGLVYDRSDCTHDHHVVVLGALHGSLGYDFLWLAKRGEDDARREQFESILATLEWTS